MENFTTDKHISYPSYETSVIMDKFEKYKISARGYTRILKVARTIADLDGEKDIKLSHLTEALAYRNIDRF